MYSARGLPVGTFSNVVRCTEAGTVVLRTVMRNVGSAAVHGQPPRPDLDAGRLLYVGIAPQYMANRTSTQNLRKRVRYHYRGNAAY